MELGQNKVQSMDYVYTINGWLKGMNSSTLDNTRDVGKDGGLGYFSANNQEHLENAIDVSAYTLGYFGGDYKSIAGGTGFEADYSTGTFGAGSPNLYNGNIRNLVTSIVGMAPIGSVYKYDQLNRLLSMDAYFNTSGLAASNNWTAGAISTDYKSTYTYDRNGNLKTLLRNGYAASTQLGMDNLTYNMTAPGTIPWNRLNYVTDGVSASGIYEDIDGQSTGNYGYDALGQLISDAQEGISAITWRSGDKKVQKIERNSTKPNASQMEFIYNPFGQRILKIEKPRVSGVLQPSNSWKYSYYSYDANGQVLAVYDLILGTTTQKADLNELHLYGASRLGMIEHPVSLWNNGSVTYTPANPATHKAGEMRYEITNYLGNVNAVVNDRKIPRATLVKATFSVSNESWTATNATLNPGSTMMQVAPSTTGSYANKAFATNSGKRYILRIRTEKGSSSDLKVVISGVAGSTTLLNAQQNTILFTAASTSTTVTVSQVTGSLNAYYIDHFELVEDHIYEATLKMSSDYYPFGMQMPGRNTNLSTYRFGYNGMEKDDEVKNISGSSYTTEFRQYDPRLGRWLSLDPLMAKYSWTSPYVAFNNNPVLFVDPFGLEGDPKAREEPTKKTYVIKGNDALNQDEFEKKLPSSGVGKGDSFHFSFEKNHPTGLISINYTSNGNGGWQRTTYYKGVSTPSTTTISGNKTVQSNDGIMAYLGPPDKETSTVRSSGGVGGVSNANGGGTITAGVTVGGGNSNVAPIGVQNTVNTPTPSNGLLSGASKAASASSVPLDLISKTGKGAENIIKNRSLYGTLNKTAGITVKTPVANVSTSLKAVKVVKIVGKVAGVVGLVGTGIQVGNDLANGHYKAATARTVVAGIQAACIFIPGPGWIIAAGIGIADAIWGDDFYNWLEE